MPKISWKITSTVALVVFVIVAAMVAPVRFASAGSEGADYDFLIGTGFLCGLDPSACPDIARADNGDTIEITGSGALSTHPKSVSGGGSFTHKDASGGVLASGTWTADQLVSFQGYGCGGDGLPSFLCGGRAIIKVTLWVGGVPVHTGLLQVDCLIGDKIPAAATEGVRLSVQDALNFNKEVSGFTVFVD
ncbi:MAG: hypothetical protein HYT43_00220 [Candidatus Taylorbacteria bacterium]|nr:hypothetical protein [Candidatus Taylorbacteria bacterium]